MSNLDILQLRLQALDFHGILIPSTDEYLSEWTAPHSRRLQWATGFRGSVGLAIAVRARAALFVDSRYTLEARQQVVPNTIEVLAASDESRFSWLANNMAPSERLAIDPRLQSHGEIERWLSFARARGISVIPLQTNPIDELWGVARPPSSSATIYDYATHFAGASAAEKCAQLQEHMAKAGQEVHLLADPEDVAWLLNVRTNDSHTNPSPDRNIVPIPLSRAIVESKGPVRWFTDSGRIEPALAARLRGHVETVPSSSFDSSLESCSKGRVVGCNLMRTPHRYAEIVITAGTLTDDPFVAHRRWVKHPNEIERAREGHYQDGQAVIRLLAWVQSTVKQRSVTELEVSAKLAEFRSELPGYRGISMPPMSASGPSGALPHYVPSEHSNRVLNDHPVYWLDSGGQYHGCSTDNTVCICVSTPEPRHIRAHTLVVKGFIALTRARFPAGLHSTQLDTLARQFLWREGLDYGHATGHGVGNYMNIHEGPVIRKIPGLPLAGPIEAGMIITNEPAYYAPDDFGIRIESHLVTVPSEQSGFLEFETLSRLPIDPRLIEQSLLTYEELSWLVRYHEELIKSYTGCFDETTQTWLQEILESYLAMAASISTRERTRTIERAPQ